MLTRPIYLQILVHYWCGVLVMEIFRIVKRTSIHKMQLSFVNDFIDTIGLSCLTNLNAIKLHRPLCYVIYLKSHS